MCKRIAHCQVVDEMRRLSYRYKLGHPNPASREDLVPILMDAFAAVVPPTRLGCSPRGSGEQGPTESLTPQPPAPLPPPVQQKDRPHSVDGAVRQRKCGEQRPTQPLPAGCPPPPINEPAAAAGQQQHWHRREGCSLVEQGPAKTPKLEPSSTSLWSKDDWRQRLAAEHRQVVQQTQQRAIREARGESYVSAASVVSAHKMLLGG